MAVIGTIFFELLPEHLFLGAMKASTLVAGGLFVLSLAVTFSAAEAGPRGCFCSLTFGYDEAPPPE